MTRTLLLLGLLLLGMTSCEDAFTTVIDADPPPFTRKMVVHAWCDDTPDAAQRLILETNRNIFDAFDQNRPITDATIEILEDGVVVGSFQHDLAPPDNEYATGTANVFNKVGAEYTLRIQAPGMPDAEARQYLPAPVEISDALFVPELTVDEDGYRVNGFKVTFTDSPNTNDYYLLECFEKGQGQFRIYLDSNDPYVQTVNDGFVLIQDEGNDGFDQTFEVYTYSANEFSDYEFILRHISKDVFQYLLSIDRYVNNDIDFFSEPSFVNSNVQNGLGIFSLSSKTVKDVRK
ncbi:MAG: DUF4249 domain-containing protein [Saprospiraceae bacterium]